MSNFLNRFFPEVDVLFSPLDHGRLRRFILTAIQLFFILCIVSFYRFETESHLNKILPLIFTGYVIHEWLPLRFRMPFFLFLGIFSVFFITGIYTGSIVVLTGLGFIGVSHLPVKHFYKVVIAIGIALLMAMIHLRFIYCPPLNAALPFLAPMFMFRWILYLYELRFEKKRVSVWHRISYFFMLPNISFPLFPIVDYKTFSRNYYDIEHSQLQNIAIRRMFRGVTHLIAYRLIYYYLIPLQTEITTLSSLLQYLVFTYLLILRLSGLFHFVLGIIALFGFNLPEIFNNFLLASSFSDLWRRINVYWSEFVVKIFYQPIYFKIKKRMGQWTLPITILIVFGINWFLHNYQWFWIHGGINLKTNDILFWFLFGVTVTLNSLYQRAYEAKGHGLLPDAWNIKISLFKVVKIYFIFIFMCILWALWCGSSIEEWQYLMSFGRNFHGRQMVILPALIGGLILLGIFVDYCSQNKKLRPLLIGITEPNPKVIAFCICLLFFMSLPAINICFGKSPNSLITHLQEDKLNKLDKLTMERGYYQKLLNADMATKELWKSNYAKRRQWTQSNDATVKTHNLMVVELKPNVKVEFKGAYISTNSWGMRDKEYKKVKDRDTYRIALVGGSYEMGSGVPDGKNFESIVEQKLNNGALEKKHKHFEILNFAVGGYHIFQNLKVSEEKAFPFAPDALIYSAHSQEFYVAARRLSEMIIKKVDLEYPFLYDVVRLAKINSTMSALEIESKLKVFMPVIIKWAYFRIANNCKRRGVIPVWLYVPVLEVDENAYISEYQYISKTAGEAGFITVPLTNVYKDYPVDSLKLNSWDNHPNEKGHEIIADDLFKKLMEKASELNF